MKTIQAYLAIVFISISTLLFTCNPARKNSGNKPYELKHWLSLQKYPCFGHCQVYKLNIYRNGLVILEGKEYLEKTGVYFTELSAEKIKKFIRLSDSQNWPSYQSEYTVNIPDLPITEFNYHDEHGARIKNIKSNSNLPNPIHELTKEMGSLIGFEKWTQIQKKSDLTNPEIIANEFIIDMDSSLNVQILETEFSLYDLKSQNKLSSNMNLWSFKYDDTKIGKYEMLILLRKKFGIRSVNFNRRILPRE
ncbi:MAG: DUF6438 domain-containing protein [Saprospiraceae bacterium]